MTTPVMLAVAGHWPLVPLAVIMGDCATPSELVAAEAKVSPP